MDWGNIEDMERRTTAILGAGVILDFDFNGLLRPTTDNITKAVAEQKIQGFDVDELDLIKQVYDRIVEYSRSGYLKAPPAVRFYEPSVTFVHLFDVIETLHSYNGTWKHEQYPFPLISTLVKPELHFETVEYFRHWITIIKHWR